MQNPWTQFSSKGNRILEYSGNHTFRDSSKFERAKEGLQSSRVPWGALGSIAFKRKQVLLFLLQRLDIRVWQLQGNRWLWLAGGPFLRLDQFGQRQGWRLQRPKSPTVQGKGLEGWCTESLRATKGGSGHVDHPALRLHLRLAGCTLVGHRAMQRTHWTLGSTLLLPQLENKLLRPHAGRLKC